MGLLWAVLCLSMPVHAEWTAAARGKDQTFYIDAATLTKRGEVWRVAILQNWDKPQSVVKGVMQSALVTWEFKCREMQYRDVSFTGYAGPMATGESWTGEGGGEWRYYTPDSVAEALAEVVC